MTTSALSTRLTALSDANKTTLQLIHRLAKLHFQPGSTPLDSEEGDVRVELSSEIHDSLKQQEEELDLLKQEVEDIASGGLAPSRRRDSEKDRERARLSVQVARLEEDLRQARSQFRRAQLQAKRNAELAKQKERELLFAGIQEGSSTPVPGRRRGKENLSQDELIVQGSSDVTTALRRLHQSMRVELERSQFAQETLDQSTAALAELSEHYSGLDTLLSSSRTLLSTLLRSQKSDTWYLETSFYILITTIIWLVYRRFLYGPLWWFAWLPLKLSYRLFFWVLATIGLTGRSTPAAAAQSQTANSSLIVKPSATGRPPPIRYMEGQAPAVPVGGGGRGAKQEQDPSPEGSMSQKVGQMVETSQQQQQRQQEEEGVGGSTAEGAPIVRGDGKVLQKSDAPRNPKKRMFDVNVENQKYEEMRKRDEL